MKSTTEQSSSAPVPADEMRLACLREAVKTYGPSGDPERVLEAARSYADFVLGADEVGARS